MYLCAQKILIIFYEKVNFLYKKLFFTSFMGKIVHKSRPK